MGISGLTPSFLPRWWPSLRRSQQCKLRAYTVFYLLTCLTLVSLFTIHPWGRHKQQFIYFLKPGYKIQRIRFWLEVQTEVGFHSATEVTYKLQVDYEKLGFRTKQRAITFFRKHLAAAREEWETCLKETFRGRIFSQWSSFLLTLGMMGMMLAPALYLLSRRQMILTVERSVYAMAGAILLRVAAVSEFRDCLRELNRSAKRNIRVVFSVESTVDHGILFGLLTSLATCVLPLMIIGYDLLWFDSDGL
ncbi:unnamed protein product [Calicophoron daubneyi]|uniref:Uncharacterized protein n=1 Tax=Calicophoron daubneyi TaxID=300641 RepID=A0AAV2TES9_CALDB